MKNKTIGILMGGYSDEFHISMQSGEVVYTTLKNHFYCYKIQILKNNWYLIDGKNKYEVRQKSFSVSERPHIKFDCIFNVIHGAPGEDGQMKKYFEKLKIPITGCDSYAAELTYDKIKCLDFLSSNGIQTAKSFKILKNDNFDIDEVISKVGLPCFVKASRSGSSFGIYKAKNKNDVLKSIESSFKLDTKVLIESNIEGREFSVGVISYHGGIKVLPITEIISKNDFFDYNAKYEGEAEEITPAKISNNLKSKLNLISENIYKLLSLKGFSRSEFIVNENGVFFLETNTIPGLTNESILPQQALKANISLLELFKNAIHEVI